jgi:membrane protein DedA with SNARE-associated domain
MHLIGHLIHAYGLLTVAAIVGLECAGIPLPGETALLLAAVYAGTKHDLNIVSVLLTAAGAAIVGRTIGYVIGYEFHWLLLQYGNYVRMTERRIKLGEYLFLRHGGKIVFVAQFLPVLRTVAGVFAGINVMPWRNFLLANVAGSCIWAVTYGYAAYALGRQFERLEAPIVVLVGLITVVAFVVGAIFVHRHEAQLSEEAERALPGPLKSIERKTTWRRILNLSS